MTKHDKGGGGGVMCCMTSCLGGGGGESVKSSRLVSTMFRAAVKGVQN